MNTICFDFDGVLAAYDEWENGKIGDPLPEGIRLAQLCEKQGYKIVINTCRTHPQHGAGNQREQFLAIKKWLYDNKVSYDWVEMKGKPIADVYVDDRGLKFEQKAGHQGGYAEVLFNKFIKTSIENGGVRSK